MIVPDPHLALSHWKSITWPPLGHFAVLNVHVTVTVVEAGPLAGRTLRLAESAQAVVATATASAVASAARLIARTAAGISLRPLTTVQCSGCRVHGSPDL